MGNEVSTKLAMAFVSDACSLQCTASWPGFCATYAATGVCVCSRLFQPSTCRRPYLWFSRPCQTLTSPLSPSPTLKKGQVCWTWPLPLLRPMGWTWFWPMIPMLTDLQLQNETAQQVLCMHGYLPVFGTPEESCCCCWKQQRCTDNTEYTTEVVINALHESFAISSVASVRKQFCLCETAHHLQWHCNQ